MGAVSCAGEGKYGIGRTLRRHGCWACLEAKGVDYIPTEKPAAVGFDHEWELFLAQVRDTTRLDVLCDTVNAQVVWRTAFYPLFFIRKGRGEIGVKEYTTEKEFGDALFSALRQSLGIFCLDPEDGVNDMKLKGPDNIGFATEVKRSGRLGLASTYGIPGENKTDHCCVVFGNKNVGKQRIDEATAAVELKPSTSSCEDYDRNS
jgi:hypothetical protein